jgi:hypothetical protein
MSSSEFPRTTLRNFGISRQLPDFRQENVNRARNEVGGFARASFNSENKKVAICPEKSKATGFLNVCGASAQALNSHGQSGFSRTSRPVKSLQKNAHN